MRRASGDALPVTVEPDVGGGFRVELGDVSHHIVFETPLREVVIHGSIDGKPFCAQIERLGLAYRVSTTATRSTPRSSRRSPRR